MKFLSSASSSAASTTTTTTTTTSSSASSNGRSLAGLLRKLLCFNSLPTNPADQLNDTGFDSGELDNFVCLETEEKVGDNTANPGIVARLMGLESMPQNDSAKNQMTPNRIARCRSMNYDSWRENEGQNRHVKTSLSFRELPTFLELENDDFFVLSFESEVESKEIRSKATRSELGSRKLVKRGERSKRKCGRRGLPGPEDKDKENQEPNKVVSIDKANRRIDQNVATQLKPVTLRENCSGRIQRKENEECISASKKVETECDSKNSSPVSVLDFSEPIIDPQVPTSEGSKSRRKISAELEDYKHSPLSPCNPSTYSSGDVEKRRLVLVDGKCRGSRSKDHRRQKYVGRSGEICKMAKGAMMESNWVYKELWKVEDFEVTGAEFELHILETLLNELVDQLVENPSKSFCICNT